MLVIREDQEWAILRAKRLAKLAGVFHCIPKIGLVDDDNRQPLLSVLDCLLNFSPVTGKGPARISRPTDDKKLRLLRDVCRKGPSFGGNLLYDLASRCLG